jgi:hypothetical protein
VISFDFYSALASYAIGMFMCLKMPTSDPEGVSWHWVLDVRMQCPDQCLDSWWGALALVLGVFLLTLCIIYPVGIAVVLVHKARNNTLDPDRSGISSEGGHGGLWGFITSSLAFRFADYDVNYRQWAKASSGDNSEPRGALQVLRDTVQCIKQWLHDFWSSRMHPVGYSLAQLRMLLVLTWDSILDFQRIVLALLGLSVMLHELHQVLLVALVLGVYLMLMLAVRPWRSDAIFRLQVLATSVLVLSCCGIMAGTVSGDGHYSENDTNRLAGAVSWAIIAMNLLYMAIGLCTLFVCAWRNFSRWRERHNGHQGCFLALLVDSAGRWLKAQVVMSGDYGPKPEVRHHDRV